MYNNKRQCQELYLPIVGPVPLPNLTFFSHLITFNKHLEPKKKYYNMIKKIIKILNEDNLSFIYEETYIITLTKLTEKKVNDLITDLELSGDNEAIGLNVRSLDIDRITKGSDNYNSIVKEYIRNYIEKNFLEHKFEKNKGLNFYIGKAEIDEIEIHSGSNTINAKMIRDKYVRLSLYFNYNTNEFMILIYPYQKLLLKPPVEMFLDNKFDVLGKRVKHISDTLNISGIIRNIDKKDDNHINFYRNLKKIKPTPEDENLIRYIIKISISKKNGQSEYYVDASKCFFQVDLEDNSAESWSIPSLDSYQLDIKDYLVIYDEVKTILLDVFKDGSNQLNNK